VRFVRAVVASRSGSHYQNECGAPSGVLRFASAPAAGAQGADQRVDPFRKRPQSPFGAIETMSRFEIASHWWTS
jgi:hypothetical protein